MAEGPAHGPASGLERSLSAARATPQRPAWLASRLGSMVRAEPRPAATMNYAWVVVAVVAMIAMLIGGLIVGGIIRLPPVPGPLVVASAQASSAPSRPGLVAYTVIEELEPGVDCTEGFVSMGCYLPRLWVSNADGTDAHELLPDRPGRQGVVAWSPDGGRLLFSEDSPGSAGLMLTDASGSEPRPLDTICEWTCSGFDGVVFSPGGLRLAFVRYGIDEMSSVIAIMDLATGETWELEATRITDPVMGINDAPRWSPDSTTLVFARQNIVVPGDEAQTLLFVVGADGTGLRQLVPAELGALDPDWSPDGSRIVFTSTVTEDVTVDPLVIETDIYTVRSDGSDIQRLTTDGASARPTWTADGRIVFAHLPPDETGEALARSYAVWLMDANGASPRRLQADSAAALTDAGCMTCPYPPPLEAEIFILNDAVWQPTP
jgi:dipeptidyl aminopeptidase/acylaminoacyl peptidase